MHFQKIEGPVLAVDEEGFPKTNHPEFLFIGRSNVGKSTVINKLLGRKNLAYTSQKPGKTKTLNFYLVDDVFRIVDAPGYGYAKTSKKRRAFFGHMFEKYLTKRIPLRHVFLLIDFRHPPTEDDKTMAGFLNHCGRPFTIIATKTDKVSNNKRAKHLKTLVETLRLDETREVILFSKEEKDCREPLLAKLGELLAALS